MRRNRMLPRRVPSWRQLSVALVLLVAAASCSSDATESEEYQSLEADYEALEETHRELKTEKQALEEEAQALSETGDELREERQALEEDLDTARSSLEAAEASLDEAEASLEEGQGASDEPWPDELKALFVEGCSEAPPDEDLSAEGVGADQQRVVCECTVEELSGTVSMVDFVTFSMLAYSVAEAELDPVTGLPSGIDEEFAQALITATAGCLFAQTGSSNTDAEQSSAELRMVDSGEYGLSVGECVDEDQIERYLAGEPYAIVACAEPHDPEVLFVREWPEGPYPGDAEVADELEFMCFDEIEGHVGTPYETSSLDIWSVWPDASAWKQGERYGECLVYDIDEAKLTGSARASGW